MNLLFFLQIKKIMYYLSKAETSTAGKEHEFGQNTTEDACYTGTSCAGYESSHLCWTISL